MKSGKIIWKRAVLLMGVLLFLCGLTGLFFNRSGRSLLAALRAQAWQADPGLAAETAKQLIDFDLPRGYRAEKVVKFQAEDSRAIIIFNQEHPSDLIYISQIPGGILGDEESQTTYETRESHAIADQLYDTHTVGTQSMVIRGQPTDVRTLEGTDKDGQAVKQLACMFTGKSGDVIVVIVASQATWDQVMVDDFLKSIR